MRSKSKPSLKNKCHNPSPVKQSTHHSNFHNHIMKPDMIDNEGKSMHKCQEEKGIGRPAMEDLKPLVRNSCEKCDPIRLACSCAIECQLFEVRWRRENRTRQMACMLKPSIQILSLKVVSHRNPRLTSSMAVESNPCLSNYRISLHLILSILYIWLTEKVNRSSGP